MTATLPNHEAAPPQAARYDWADWSSAFGNIVEERDGWIEAHAVEGEIPAALRGTLYRNGPGRLERSGHWVHHPFDGDGMVLSAGFGDGRAYLRNRFVRTEGFQREEKAGRWLYRGVFGTRKPGGVLANAFDLRLKNVANTHVIDWGGQLLALWEAGLPHALDPVTLATRGEERLNGVLADGEAFSAHPRFDPGHHGDGRLVTFGLKTGPRSTIRLLEFDRGGHLIRQRQDRFTGFAFLHDFAITPNWAIFLKNALHFNPLPYLLGCRGAAQCLRSGGGGAEFWLIPRGEGEPVIVPAGEGFVFHHVNAWEEGDELVLDSIHYADFPSVGPDDDFRRVDFDQLPPGLLERSRIHTRQRRCTRERLSERCCEFATVHPRHQGRPSRFAWLAVTERCTGNDPLQAIRKLDLHSGSCCVWSAAPRGFVNEPVMVPRPGATAEDDGWILCLVWNGARRATDLVILDAADLRQEAVLHLPLAVPYGLHGSWSERHTQP